MLQGYFNLSIIYDKPIIWCSSHLSVDQVSLQFLVRCSMHPTVSQQTNMLANRCMCMDHGTRAAPHSALMVALRAAGILVVCGTDSHRWDQMAAIPQETNALVSQTICYYPISLRRNKFITKFVWKLHLTNQWNTCTIQLSRASCKHIPTAASAVYSKHLTRTGSSAGGGGHKRNDQCKSPRAWPLPD